MIIGYKKKFPWGTETNFKRKILEGTKLHTMREDPHDRWHAERKIQHAHGVRTKQYDHFADGECKSTQKVTIKYWKSFVSVYIDNDFFYNSTCRKGGIISNRMIKLIRNDGFESIEDFFRWFKVDWNGKIIHFTDLKY